jgi:prepilin-type N-terminal cleavage/methylation domain-containing protein
LTNSEGGVSTTDDGRSPGRRGGKTRAAFTLVEVMLAALVLAVLAIGGAALMYRGRADMVRQQYKRAAIECANARLEVLTRGLPYATVAGWVGSPPPVDSVVLNGRPNYPMTTTVNNGPDNCLAITVRVQYGPNSSDTVSLDTLRSK